MNGSGQRVGPDFTEAYLFTAGNVQREPSLNWLVWFLNSQQIFFPPQMSRGETKQPVR